MYDKNGTLLGDTNFGATSAWKPRIQAYNFELNVTSGTQRLFINGVQYGNTQTFTTSNRVFSNYFYVDNGDVETSYRNMYIYPTVQHTANFTVYETPDKWMIGSFDSSGLMIRNTTNPSIETTLTSGTNGELLINGYNIYEASSVNQQVSGAITTFEQLRYASAGNMVTVSVAWTESSAISNDYIFFPIGTIPSSFLPTEAIMNTYISVKNNSVLETGIVDIFTDGSVRISRSGVTKFDATGICGFGFSVAYNATRDHYM
jgi:hypothetical protein